MEPRRATGTPLSPAHRALGLRQLPYEPAFDARQPVLLLVPREAVPGDDAAAHHAAGLPDQCEICHKPSHTSFSQASFQHSAYFPLAGVHATQACASCHKNNVYKGTPRDCYGCHRTTTSARRARTTRRPGSRPRASRATGRRTRAGRATFNHNTRLSAGRRPRHAGLRGLPQEQRLQGHAARLLRLPPDQLRAHDEPEPRGGRVPDRVRVVPQAVGPELEGDVQPQQRVPAGRACTPRRPARRATRTTSTRARRATATAATARTTSAPRTRTTRRRASRPRASRAIGPRMRAGAPRSTTTRSFPLVGRARDAGLHGLPQEQRLQGHAARLLRLPPHELRAHHQPEPRRGRLPDDVRVVPQRLVFHVVGEFRSQPVLRPRRAPSLGGVQFVPQEQRLSRARRATATRATRRNTTARRTRTTGPPGSRPRARRATGTRIRPSTRDGSITRGSRSRPGGTPAGRARSATPTRTTTRCSPARPAIRGRGWTPSTRAAQGTATTPPPATPATRQAGRRSRR